MKLHSISRPYTLSQQSAHTLDLSRCLYLTHWLVQPEMCYLSVITVCYSLAAGVRHAAFANSRLLDFGLCRCWPSDSSDLQHFSSGQHQPLTPLVLKFARVHTQAQKRQCTQSIVANSTWQEYRIACKDQVKAETILLPSNLPNNQRVCDCPFLSTSPLLPHVCYTPIHLEFSIPLVWSLSPKHPIISCI